MDAAPLSRGELLALVCVAVREITSNTPMDATEALTGLERVAEAGMLKVLQYSDMALLVFRADEVLACVPRQQLARAVRATSN